MKHPQTPRKWKTVNLNTSNSDALAPNSIYIVDISDHYRNYDYAEITNLNSDNDAIIILNGSQEQPLPKGTQAVINRPFQTIQIKNNGSTNILANEIQVNYQHTSTKEDFVNKAVIIGRIAWGL